MSGWLKNIINKVRELNKRIDKYKEDTLIQSLPSYTYVNRAKKLLMEDKFEEAKDILLKALELPQKDSLVHKYLGAAYEKLGDIQNALTNYQMSADLDPQDKTICSVLDFVSCHQENMNRQRRRLIMQIEFKRVIQIHLLAGVWLILSRKNIRKPEKNLLRAAKINKYNFSAVFLGAVSEIKLEMYDKAEVKLTFLANVCPNANNTFEFARLKAIKNDYDSAIHYALKSLDYNVDMLPAYILLGQIYASKFDITNSLKYFEMAEQKELIVADLYLEWGKVLEKFEYFDDAKLKLLKALEMSPENIEVMAYLGLCCVTRKEFEEASPLLEKVLSVEPENLVVKQALGIIAYENDEIEKALTLLRSNDEESINCHYMAKCYEKLKNDTKVKDYYEASILHNSQSAAVFIDYAKYLIARNDYKEACRKLRKGLKAQPENISLLNLMFYTSYILVKENLCDYNVKETLAIAQKVESVAPGMFEYPEQKAELEAFLQNKSESE